MMISALEDLYKSTDRSAVLWIIAGKKLLSENAHEFLSLVPNFKSSLISNKKKQNWSGVTDVK